MRSKQLWGDKPGWIYAAQAEGDPLVKIGYTCTTLAYRLHLLRRQYHPSDLAIVAAVRVAQGTRSLEQSLHRVLKPQCIKGEWFYLHMDQATLEALIQEAIPLARALGITIDLLAGQGEKEEMPTELATAGRET